MTEKRPFKVGLFGILAIVGAFLIFIWLLTFNDPTLLNDLVTVSFFIIGGMVLGFLLGGVRFEALRTPDFLMTILSTVVNVVMYFYINQLVPMSIPFAVVNPQLFGVLVGVAEECFFRVGLCAMIENLTGQGWLAVIGSSAVWSAYHVAKYGGSTGILFMIFLCGCILGATFIWTKSADGSIFGHGLVNYIVLAGKKAVVG